MEYRKALDLEPNYASAHYNLGNILRDQGKNGEAAASYRRALAIKPDFSNAHCNLGAALWGLGDIPKGCASYSRHAELQFKAGAHRSPDSAAPQKTRHDQEQRDYLTATGVNVPAIDTAFRLTDGARLPTPAVNPANAAEIAEQWRTRKPQIVVIDNLSDRSGAGKAQALLLGLDHLAQSL